MKKNALPYFNQRKADIDMLVIHCQAFDEKQSLQILNDVQLSAHYMIGLNGKIYQLVDDKYRAWHTKTGASYWRKVEDINSHSIGIEICSLSLGQEQYTKNQIHSLLRLCKTLTRKYHIKKQNVVGHSDIFPSRKPDPGKAFPWKYLARHGIGFWYNINDAKKVSKTDERMMLSEIGYNVADLTAAKWAFSKRFLPDVIPTDNVRTLIDNPVPENAQNLIEQGNFKKVLKAVYYKVKSNSKSF
ncbi:MAG: N-acetylmuramoyl-L-alanine amidase [Alphaproteobacteria bacterium]|nr:N-acetylmuramoyl-L-alanine amidase [Alphaproteobacteria bacterium]